MGRRHRACKDPATKVKSCRAKNRDLERVHTWNPFIREGCCWQWMASTRGLAHPFGGTAPTISMAKSAVLTNCGRSTCRLGRTNLRVKGAGFPLADKSV